MPYIPHTDDDVREMLATIGVGSIDELFREVPEDLRLKGEMKVPGRLDEARVFEHMRALSEKNLDLSKTTCFLGAGIYDRFVPSVVGAVLARGEFLTAYTPYQPEVSQGYLQTIYEFQSMVAELYGMELANASMYDGPTAAAEAAVMASGITNRKSVAVSAALHPHYRAVLQTYCWSLGIEVLTLGVGDGATEGYDTLSDAAACVVVQYPNVFGVVEDLSRARAEADRVGAKLVVVADPTACALLKPPGEHGADIVVGEGQPLGIAMGFGGPMLGLFACKREFVRSIPGRIVGRTSDHQGRTGYTMTLRTREQDIRREKATSNICTNEALMALAATVYMTGLGKHGMKQVAEGTVRNTQYAMQVLAKAGGKVKFGGRVFGEFVLSLPYTAEAVRDALLDEGVLAGHPLGDWFPGMDHDLLVAVTELRTREQIDDYATKLAKVLAAS